MLPAYPWQTRPVDEPLTAEEVCEALWVAEGDVRVASQRLRVGSLVLRKFIERSTRARAIIRECDACLSDEAAATLRSALRDEDARRQDWAVRYILNSRNAKDKGWSSTDDASTHLNQQGPLINLTVPAVIQWQNGEKFGPPQPQPPTIDVVPTSTSPNGSIDE